MCVVTGELNQSVLSEYEERLAMKRQEVSQLQRQRDKLLATQSKLQALQHNITEASSTASGLLTVNPGSSVHSLVCIVLPLSYLPIYYYTVHVSTRHQYQHQYMYQQCMYV